MTAPSNSCPLDCRACLAGEAFMDHSCPICDDPNTDVCPEFLRLEQAWIEELRAVGEWDDEGDNSAALDLHPPQPVTSLETK